MLDTQLPFSLADFERQVRDALANLHDPASLATHPLAALLPASSPEGARSSSRSDQLRNLLLAAIERLRPSADVEHKPSSPEWRPYQLLHGRYVEGESLQQMQIRLSLSERQLRREHSRAVEAVARYLQDTLLPTSPGLVAADELAPGAYPVTAGPLDLLDLLEGVADTLSRRVESEGAWLELAEPASRPRVLSDRIILRQVLLSMFNYALDLRSHGPVRVHVGAAGERVLVRTQFHLEAATVDEERALTLACFWCEHIDAQLIGGVERPAPGTGQLTLSLPSADEPLLLVVDDQETALRLYGRYLAQTGLKVTGVRDGSEVLGLARQLQPQAIMLDVMMPNMDGWEVLQGLKADPSTSHIPVIVCSVWEEPELASSLGASGFLPKPIKQADLLAALARLNLLQS